MWQHVWDAAPAGPVIKGEALIHKMKARPASGRAFRFSNFSTKIAQCLAQQSSRLFVRLGRATRFERADHFIDRAAAHLLARRQNHSNSSQNLAGRSRPAVAQNLI